MGAEQVVAHLEAIFGAALPQSITEVVPAGLLSVSVHVVPPSDERDYVTMFTSGMSDVAMTTPEEMEEFAFAELFLQLPAGWPYKDTASRDAMWPVMWLQQCARRPHEWGTWLGAMVGLLANGEPPQPLHSGLPFTTWLFLNEHRFTRDDGHEVHVYRMSPLYTEERQLEIDEGAWELCRALDKLGTSLVIDPHRPPVV